MSCLLPPDRLAFLIVIENNTGGALEHFIQQCGTFVSKDARGVG